MTAETLAQGWWFPLSLLIAPVILVRNLIQRRRVASLPAVDSLSGTGTPLDPGKPVHRRLAMLGLLAPLAVIAFFAIPSTEDGLEVYIGRCVQEVPVGEDGVQVVYCDKPHFGKVISVAESEDQCPPEADSWVFWKDRGQFMGQPINPTNGQGLCVVTTE